MNKVLGLDLGTNSVGWSLIEEDGNGNPKQLMDCGTRIFIKAVEEKTPTPKNHKRRQARMARRLIQRRARRSSRLENYLIKLGFLPKEVKDAARRESILNDIGSNTEVINGKTVKKSVDPYFLRTKALDSKLEPYELGRVLLHLVARRGFQSNRKTLFSDMLDDPDVRELLQELEKESPETATEAQKEESEFKEAIGELQNAIIKSGCRTLGEYLHKLPAIQRRRNRRTGREMYKHELELILAEQSKHHAAMTADVQGEIEHIIFYQRPLKTPKKTIGFCSLEPKSRRAHMARLEYQRFRYLQDINILSYDHEQVDVKTGEITGIGITLSDKDRNILVTQLERSRKVSWGSTKSVSVKKLLGVPRNVKFNLEASKDGLPGNQTACAIRAAIGDMWDGFLPEQQLALVEDLITYEKKPALKKRLVEHWKLPPRKAIELITADFPDGYANLSLKAIRKLLPFMEKGMKYSDARQAAGYTYEQKTDDEKFKPLHKLPLPPQIRNPIVQKALFEVRRVVNAVIATYGKPDAIRIELPRELTMSKKQKKAHQDQQNKNQKANEKAEEQYQIARAQNPQLNLPVKPGGEDRLRYRLWQEQEGLCLYTGKQISMTELFSSAVEIDHILPYSRTVDDSYLNKVIVMAAANRDKGNRTPFEAYSGDDAVWERIVQRARGLHPAKKRNVLCEELGAIDGFINSQLTDTAYISREVKDYVSKLGCDVSVTKGVITAWLRNQWGLNSVLGGDVKNRADHRHHAVDATVVALTSRSLYMKIVHAAEQGRDIPLPPPWSNFRQDVEGKMANIIVSHAPVRKLVGAFHEETGYGVQEKEDGGLRVVCRKQLDEKFDKKQIAKVVDPHLRDVLEGHLEKFNGNAKVAFNAENRPSYGKSQSPLRHVRIITADNFNPDSHLVVRDRNGKPYRYHPFGNNHHVEILRNKLNGKIKSEFVTTWQAAQRVRRDRKSLIQMDHGAEWEFLMALCISDLVSVVREGRTSYFRVQNLDPDGGRLVLREHLAATLDNDFQKIRKSVNSLINDLHLQQVQISPLGHIRNDKANH